MECLLDIYVCTTFPRQPRTGKGMVGGWERKEKSLILFHPPSPITNLYATGSRRSAPPPTNNKKTEIQAFDEHNMLAGTGWSRRRACNYLFHLLRGTPFGQADTCSCWYVCIVW